MPIPISRPASADIMTGWEYIHTANYSKYIYSDNDFFTMGGAITPYLKEYVLDTLNRNFFDLHQNLKDPAFTELYRSEHDSIMPQFYAMLARDMHNVTWDELSGLITKTHKAETDDREKLQENADGLSKSENDSYADAMTVNDIGLVESVSNVENDTSSLSQTGTDQTSNATAGATRIVSTQTGVTTGSGGAVTTTGGDAVTASLSTGRTGTGGLAESTNEASAGNISSNFPMVIDAGGGNSGTVDTWLSGSGAGNASRYATDGAKSANKSTAGNESGNKTDNLGVGGSLTSNLGQSTVANNSATGTTGQTITNGDAVTSSGETVTNISDGSQTRYDEEATNIVKAHTDTSRTGNVNHGEGKVKFSNDLSRNRNDLKKYSFIETVNGLTYAEIQNMLNIAFANRISAFEFLKDKLSQFWTIKFGVFPPHETFKDYPLF